MFADGVSRAHIVRLIADFDDSQVSMAFQTPRKRFVEFRELCNVVFSSGRYNWRVTLACSDLKKRASTNL